MKLNMINRIHIKRILINGVTRITKRKYVKDVRKRASDLPELTVLSSDCLAGILYHDLNRKFLSPTINLWFEEQDFLKFCISPQYYLNGDFRFLSETEKEVPHPVGCLGEEDRCIKIYFEHYGSNQECEEAWNRRKSRIDWENLFVVMSDLELTDEDVQKFYQIKAKRKIMFTWHPERADGKEIFQIRHHGKDHVRRYSNLNWNGFRDFELFFDYVKWLHMEDGFMLEPIKGKNTEK